jgi:TM2 domain-containing membrane protein YozV
MKSKPTTIVLAFFLGWCGIHRFYLGQTKKGLAYLLLFWTYIPAVIALIDVIMFLAMSREKFDRKYNGIRAVKKERKDDGKANEVRIEVPLEDFFNEEPNSYFPQDVSGLAFQIVESLGVIGRTKSLDTIKGRHDFLEGSIKDLRNYFDCKNPRYYSDVQSGLDQYKQLYYDKEIQDYQMMAVTQPGEFIFNNFYCVALLHSFERYIEVQEHQILQLKRQSAITARRKKIVGVLESTIQELDEKGWGGETHLKVKRELEKYKDQYGSMFTQLS